MPAHLKSRVLAVVGLVGVLSWTCATAQAPRTTYPWTSVGSAGIVNAGDQSKVVYGGATVSIKPGAWASLTYNITATTDFFGTLCEQQSPALQILYRDEWQPIVLPGPPTRPRPHPLPGDNRVVATLFRVSLTDGSVSQLLQFDSYKYPARKGFQSQKLLGANPHIFDFYQNAYWLEVKLVDTTTEAGLPPAVEALQVSQWCPGL